MKHLLIHLAIYVSIMTPPHTRGDEWRQRLNSELSVGVAALRKAYQTVSYSGTITTFTYPSEEIGITKRFKTSSAEGRFRTEFTTLTDRSNSRELGSREAYLFLPGRSFRLDANSGGPFRLGSLPAIESPLDTEKGLGGTLIFQDPVRVAAYQFGAEPVDKFLAAKVITIDEVAPEREPGQLGLRIKVKWRLLGDGWTVKGFFILSPDFHWAITETCYSRVQEPEGVKHPVLIEYRVDETKIPKVKRITQWSELSDGLRKPFKKVEVDSFTFEGNPDDISLASFGVSEVRSPSPMRYTYYFLLASGISAMVAVLISWLKKSRSKK
ncbi:hypothetical protein K2X85_17995 [bacterium]|nr:hypothetical protein [bacterium]